MTKKDIDLIEKAILHWKYDILPALLNDMVPKSGIGASSCPLCRVYNKGNSNGCGKCPIKIKVKHDFCLFTPFIKVQFFCNKRKYKKAVSACLEEIELLESLLDGRKVKKGEGKEEDRGSVPANRICLRY
jgi:hypothetical protein